MSGYKDRITSDPDVMVGKPVIKGTRIPVERIIAHLARDPDLADLLTAYPELTIEDVKAALEFAHASISDETDHRSRQRTVHV